MSKPARRRRAALQDSGYAPAGVRSPGSQVITRGMSSGYLKLLSDGDIKKIHKAALEILSTIGMGSPIPSCIQAVIPTARFSDSRGIPFLVWM